jgi:hypothetical protein
MGMKKHLLQQLSTTIASRFFFFFFCFFSVQRNGEEGIEGKNRTLEKGIEGITEN